jgi:hypothetical protein
VFPENTVHPLPDISVGMHERRDVRNRMAASTQVQLSCIIRVCTRSPSQPCPAREQAHYPAPRLRGMQYRPGLKPATRKMPGEDS